MARRERVIELFLGIILILVLLTLVFLATNVEGQSYFSSSNYDSNTGNTGRIGGLNYYNYNIYSNQLVNPLYYKDTSNRNVIYTNNYNKNYKSNTKKNYYVHDNNYYRNYNDNRYRYNYGDYDGYGYDGYNYGRNSYYTTPVSKDYRNYYDYSYSNRYSSNYNNNDYLDFDVGRSRQKSYEGILGGDINKYQVNVRNNEHEGGYFTVKFNTVDYYGNKRTADTQTIYLSPHENERVTYKNVFDDDAEYKYWGYEVISNSKK